MISSAVIIPEQETEKRSHSPSLKRRQSSASFDSNKRLRLDTQNSSDNGTQPNSGGVMSPPTRRRSALGTGAAEEKKRGQRLFGALLGTLSQTSSKPAHKKRDEIEQRQRERMRKDTEDREEQQRRKREEVDKLRRIEQEAWEKESRHIRHRNMRAMAGFLQTKTEPKLYYKPWELRGEEEERIKRQVQDIEENIRGELGYSRTAESTDNNEKDDAPSKPEKALGVQHEDQGTAEQDARVEEGQAAIDDPTHEKDESEADLMKVDKSPEQDASTLEQKPAEEERAKEDDHAGEELVEGQEDDVIY